MKIFAFFSPRRQSNRGVRAGQGISLLVMAFIVFSVARGDVLIGDLPNLGQQDIRSQNEQTSAGLRYLRFLNAQGMAAQDPGLTYYLEQSMVPLLPAFSTEDGSRDLLIFGVSHRSFNAFALPGGLIGVHDGLLDALTETPEVQAILAHELGHLALGHHQRLAQARQQSTGLVIASILLAPLAWQVDPDLAIGMIYGAQGTAIQQQLAFSRSMEEEADRMAVSAMRSGGLPLDGMISAYETMASGQRLQTGTAGTAYPTTHPDVRARLADLRNRIEREPQRDNPVLDIPLCWVQLDRSLNSRSTDERCALYRAWHEADSQEELYELWDDLLTAYPAHPYLVFRASDWLTVQAVDEQRSALAERVKAKASLAPDSWLVALSMLHLHKEEVVQLSGSERARWRRTLQEQAAANDLMTWNTLRLAYPEEHERHMAFRAQAQTSWINGDLDTAVRQLRRAVELSDAGSQRSQWENQLRRWERAQR
ncbi:MAG: M48 family metalloprotease [Natronospirillum sp.]|uniref:M48 family metallopeptidase n=1 Tax=Natronospirillum sp. TaxID=2812955 RepID=UPI0025EF0032|nr:M48 family metalloprotease [Natronospirillum sp.]MCH8552233.1 M48 family metalloprotease [Natronospirillum sp.]